MTPDDLRYTSEHEWVSVVDDAGTVRVGITDFAQRALGDVVFVTLPEEGASVAPGQGMGEIESTKSVSELYAPIAGVIARRNDELERRPELVNADPYGEGWMVEITVADTAGLDDVLAGLLDAGGYDALTAG